MENAGIEPATSCMLSTRSTNWANPPSCLHPNQAKLPSCAYVPHTQPISHIQHSTLNTYLTILHLIPTPKIILTFFDSLFTKCLYHHISSWPKPNVKKCTFGFSIRFYGILRRKVTNDQTSLCHTAFCTLATYFLKMGKILHTLSFRIIYRSL